MREPGQGGNTESANGKWSGCLCHWRPRDKSVCINRDPQFAIILIEVVYQALSPCIPKEGQSMKHDMVAIGASAGGVEALKTIVSALPHDFPASVFVTLHTAPAGPALLAQILGNSSPLPVVMTNRTEEIRPGQIYVAPPNLHLIVKRGFVANHFLPKENGTRPAIDPMFRSAAHSYSRRVIGVLLTGFLDDGTAGLGVIKDEGGITVVQDPKDAMYPAMPASAIKNTKPDYIVPLSQIAPLLVKLVKTKVKGPAPEENQEVNEIAPPVTCPGCGGVLTQYASDRNAWFQCMVGHRFNPETVVAEQNTAIEEHFWRLVSLLKEKKKVAQTMSSDANGSIQSLIKPDYFDEQIEAAEKVQGQIQDILDEFGPALFADISQKDEANIERDMKEEGGKSSGRKPDTALKKRTARKSGRKN